MNDFLPPAPCAALITSRIQQVAGVQKRIELDRMTPAEARQLMEAILGAEAVAAESAAAQLAERCAFNPLAVEIAARRALQFVQTEKRPIQKYFERARARFAELAMDGDARWDMDKVFDISYLDLSASDQKRFRALAAFAPTGFAPAAAEALWQAPDETSRALMRFTNLSLVKQLPDDRYRLHDLLDEYAEGKLKGEKAEEQEVKNILAEWLVALFSQDEVFGSHPLWCG